MPVESLRGLRNLTLLDLSRNRIERVPSAAFATLHSLATLKLADNNLSLAADAFQVSTGIGSFITTVSHIPMES